MPVTSRVIPAKAGIQAAYVAAPASSAWTPACAGVTATYDIRAEGRRPAGSGE